MMNFIIFFGLVGVTSVLALGLFNMARGGSPRRAQILMRWRVGLQFAVLMLIALASWLALK